MSRFGRSFVGSLVFAFGLVCLWVGERLIGAGGARVVLSALGVLLVVGAIAVRALRLSAADGQARRAEKVLLALQLAGLVALVLYFLQSDVSSALFGDPLSQRAPKLATALSALWPAVLAAALLPLLLVELAYAAMARAPVIEGGRIYEALFSGLGLAFAVVFAFTAVYVATERDVKWDLSYFRTARPGTAMQNLVASLEEPVDVYLFFPPASDVAEEVRGYFEDANGTGNLRLHSLDQALDLAKARELGVRGNGTVVLSRGGRRETLTFNTRLEQARTALRNLDRDAQKALLKLARSQRVVYLTTGHGERPDKRGGPAEQRASVALLRDLLTQQNYEVRTLGPAEGLATAVPEDAAAVMMIGPTSSPLPEELAALSRYLEGGGRLFIALDPEYEVDLGPLLAPVGVDYKAQTLANDQVFIARRRTLLDRAWLLVASYSSHPSVSTLSQRGSRAPMGLLGTGRFEQRKDRPGNVLLDFTVHTHPATWNDLNGNLQHDAPEEARKSWEVAVAVTRKPRPDAPVEEQGRMILLGDSDAVSDAVVANEGNALFVVDGMRWLFGEESLAGETTSEVDVPIQHTRREDVAWFYSTVFLVPAAILGAGFFATRRRRRAARAREAGR